MMSPQTIITGVPFDYNKHCHLQFGSYAQTHEDATTNRPDACTVGAICLGPTGNLQGSYKFLNLRTGKKITCRNFTPLPMPQAVIDRVNQLSKLDSQPELLTFFDRNGNEIGDNATHSLVSETNIVQDADPTTNEDEVSPDHDPQAPETNEDLQLDQDPNINQDINPDAGTLLEPNDDTDLGFKADLPEDEPDNSGTPLTEHEEIAIDDRSDFDGATTEPELTLLRRSS